MKKCVLYLLLGFMSAACSSKDEPTYGNEPKQSIVSEKHISPTEAGGIASAFMQSIGGDSLTTHSKSDWAVNDVQLLSHAITRSSENDTTFYIVGFKEGGYALVAADCNLDNKIYVYSTSSEFSGVDNPVLDIYVANALSTISKFQKTNGNTDSSPALRKPMKDDQGNMAQGEEYINGKWYKYYKKFPCC